MLIKIRDMLSTVNLVLHLFLWDNRTLENDKKFGNSMAIKFFVPF